MIVKLVLCVLIWFALFEINYAKPWREMLGQALGACGNQLFMLWSV
jgi:hypothetical protein